MVDLRNLLVFVLHASIPYCSCISCKSKGTPLLLVYDMIFQWANFGGKLLALLNEEIADFSQVGKSLHIGSAAHIVILFQDC